NRAWQEFSAAHAVQVPHGALHYRDYARLFRPDGSRSDDTAEAGIGAVLLDEKPAFEGEFTLADGHSALRLLVRPFSHDKLRGVVVLQLDVSDRKRAEERNRLLHTALDAAA